MKTYSLLGIIWISVTTPNGRQNEMTSSSSMSYGTFLNKRTRDGLKLFCVESAKSKKNEKESW